MVSSPRGAIKKRYGSLAFSSIAFTEPSVIDTFNRTENPLSNGGKWSEVKVPFVTAGAGKTDGTTWAPKELGKTSAAYWNAAEQTNPAVSALVPKVGELQGVFACVAGAEGIFRGYLLRVSPVVGGAKWQIFRYTAGIATTLVSVTTSSLEAGDSIGLSVRGGRLVGWRKHGTSWTRMAEATDSAYTKGFAGIVGFGESELGTLDSFGFGEQAASPLPSEEVQSIMRAEISGVSYLIIAVGKKLFSINTSGETAVIKEGLTEAAANKWVAVQSTSGAPNREATNGPIYLSNGVDAPQYWAGTEKGTATAEWKGKAEGAFVAVPKAKYLTYLGNRVWASGISTDTSAVRFSGFAVKTEEGEQADPTCWPKENVVWFEKEDGSPITGTGIAGSYLMVFKRHKTWAVYDLNEGENRRVSDSVGCVSYRSIVETPQGTFFLTPDQGVFVTNGSSVREVSRNVRPILQGTDSNATRAAKVNTLENAAAGFINGHYYLTYLAKDGSTKTLDYDVVLQSWWLHDLGGNQWALWEPAGTPAIYTCPKGSSASVVQAFAEGVFTDSGAVYTGANGLSCFWVSPWEPFWQYFQRHRFNQPNPKKRIRELFVDGKGELISQIFTKFGGTAETLKGTVDNADMATPTSPVTLGSETSEYQAVRYWSLGSSRVWSFLFGNNTSEPLEVDSFSVHLFFRKS